MQYSFKKFTFRKNLNNRNAKSQRANSFYAAVVDFYLLLGIFLLVRLLGKVGLPLFTLCFLKSTQPLRSSDTIWNWVNDARFCLKSTVLVGSGIGYNTIILPSGILATNGVVLGYFFLTRANIFSISKPLATTLPLTRIIYWFSKPFLSSSKNVSKFSDIITPSD